MPETQQATETATQQEAETLPEEVLPEDLDITAPRQYTIPNNSRRRLSGVVYAFSGIVFASAWIVIRGEDSPFVNPGFLICGIALLLLGAHHFFTGADLEIDDKEALMRASDAVGFDVGHASAQLGWRGWLSRPTWKVLAYSAEDQPEKRALVRLDGITGAVVDMLVEDNPEDWSQYLPDAEDSEASSSETNEV